jgi:hypothetical protein
VALFGLREVTTPSILSELHCAVESSHTAAPVGMAATGALDQRGAAGLSAKVETAPGHYSARGSRPRRRRRASSSTSAKASSGSGVGDRSTARGAGAAQLRMTAGE